MSRTRLALLTVILFLSSAGVLVAIWFLSSRGRLSNDLVTSLGLMLSFLTLLVGFLQLIPTLIPTSSDTKTLEADRAAKKLFDALKQRIYEDRNSFEFAKLRAIIPLTLRHIEDTTGSAGKSVIDMFNEHHNLLIVGKPGSGKTMSL